MIDKVLQERGERYGDYKSTAFISQTLKNTMRECRSWDRMTSAQREGLEMIQHKIARILNGDPTYIDSFRDIEGYARLMVDVMKSSDGSTDVIASRIKRKDGVWYDESTGDEET
jgi:hypothetical protein